MSLKKSIFLSLPLVKMGRRQQARNPGTVEKRIKNSHGLTAGLPDCRTDGLTNGRKADFQYISESGKIFRKINQTVFEKTL